MRQEIYGDSAEDSRLGHTPPSLRSEHQNEKQQILRQWMQTITPPTPSTDYGFTPQAVREGTVIDTRNESLAVQAPVLSPSKSTSKEPSVQPQTPKLDATFVSQEPRLDTIVPLQEAQLKEDLQGGGTSVTSVDTSHEMFLPKSSRKRKRDRMVGEQPIENISLPQVPCSARTDSLLRRSKRCKV